jgi:hypothetical protein
MPSACDGVRCTVHDGEMWMHVDNKPIIIPSRLLDKSQLLIDALASVEDSLVTKDFTLPAPKEWLQAWIACYGGEDEHVKYADTKDLMKCLLVRCCF